MSQLIDVIIPTLWRYTNFYNTFLHQYVNYSKINKIIIIDNDEGSRPDAEILTNKKIKILTYGQNIFVGPAWNKGAENAEAEIICLLNDDMFVYEDAFDYVSDLNFNKIGILGFNYLANTTTTKIVELEYIKNKPLGEQCYGFGSCMFLKRKEYPVIPESYQILFTDDYLAQNSPCVHTLCTDKIVGTMSNTLKTLYSNRDIIDRIKKDDYNAINQLLK